MQGELRIVVDGEVIASRVDSGPSWRTEIERLTLDVRYSDRRRRGVLLLSRVNPLGDVDIRSA